MQLFQVAFGLLLGLLIAAVVFIWMSMRGEAKSRTLAPIRIRVDDGKRRRVEPRPEEDNSAVDMIDLFFGFITLVLLAVMFVHVL